MLVASKRQFGSENDEMRGLRGRCVRCRVQCALELGKVSIPIAVVIVVLDEGTNGIYDRRIGGLGGIRLRMVDRIEPQLDLEEVGEFFEKV